MNSGILKTLENTNMFWLLKDFVISVEDGETQPDIVYPSAREQIKRKVKPKTRRKKQGPCNHWKDQLRGTVNTKYFQKISINLEAILQGYKDAEIASKTVIEHLRGFRYQ